MNKFAKTATSLLGRYGKDCVIIKVGSGEYNPATGTVENTEERYDARCLETGYELEHLANTLIERGDLVGYFQFTEPFDGQVGLDMKIELDGTARNFKSVQVVRPGDETLYYRFVA